MPYVPQSFVKRRTAEIMATYGEAMVLRRPVVDGQAAIADVNVMGKRSMKARSSSDDAFSGSATAESLFVQIGNTEIEAAGWPGPPVQGDILVIAGRGASIDKVDTRVLGLETICHFLYLATT